MTVKNEEITLAGGTTVTPGVNYTVFGPTIPNVNGEVVTAPAGSTTVTALLATLGFGATVALTNNLDRSRGSFSSVGETGKNGLFDVGP